MEAVKTCKDCGQVTKKTRRAMCNRCYSRQWARTYAKKNPDKQRDYSRQWAQRNPEKVRERNKRYRERNLEACRERNRRYHESNPEYFKLKNRLNYEANRDLNRARVRAWVEANTERVRELDRNRYRRDKEKRLALTRLRDHRVKLATPPWLTKEQKSQIVEMYRSRPEGFHVDHIVPLNGENVCGLHVPWNLQHLPSEINLKKSNKF